MSTVQHYKKTTPDFLKYVQVIITKFLPLLFVIKFNFFSLHTSKEAQKSERFSGSYISSFLILPVQRLPRYEMFLKQLLKNTPSSHNDYISLQSALDSVVKTTTQLDVTCHRAENVLKIVEISKLISVVRFFTSFFPGKSHLHFFIFFF